MAGSPSRIRVNLRSPGFELYFPYGISLHLLCLQSPFLTWREGSVGPDVPAAPSQWILLSFQDKQPPVLFAFLDPPPEMVTSGSSGDWTVTAKAFKGWVRVCLPLGQYGAPGTSAASLGQQANAVAKNESLWTSPTPSLTGFDIRSDSESLTAVWTFDRPGAVVPQAALLAKAGGFPIQILSGIQTTDADLIDGPVAFTSEAKFAVRFPLRRIPVGRSVSLGMPSQSMIATVSPFDVPSICDLALTSMLACRDKMVSDLVDVVTNEYYTQAHYTVEPNTQQSLPYGLNGAGVDLLAAHTLLDQVANLVSGGSLNSQPPKVFAYWLRDWSSWLVWVPDQRLARRASAILSVSGALSDVPERRLDGAMLQAGLAAERALALYQRKRGFTVDRPDLIEPFYNLRAALYQGSPNQFVDSLMSEVRIVSDEAVTAEQTEDGVLVTWTPTTTGPGRLTFEIGRPVTAEPKDNLRSLVANQALGTLTVDYDPLAPGSCSLLLKSPGWTVPLPHWAAPPAYSENR